MNKEITIFYEAAIYDLIRIFFEGDEEKIYLWFNTKNPLLGAITPNEMIKNGRVEKLFSFIKNGIDENFP